MRSILFCLLAILTLTACAQSRRNVRQAAQAATDSTSITAIIDEARQLLDGDTALAGAHLGISLYDAATGRYLYNYQGDKYFVPASNTKLFTCYAAMKYLGDSLAGLRYDTASTGYINIEGTGDPTFLHPDFTSQPVLRFLQQPKTVAVPLTDNNFGENPFGKGWPWDDYNDDYAVERSVLPMYGNVVRFFIQSDTLVASPEVLVRHWLAGKNNQLRQKISPWFTIVRDIQYNDFHPVSSNQLYRSETKFSAQDVPFRTIIKNQTSPYLPVRTYIQLLEDTLHKKIEDFDFIHGRKALPNVIHSQPTDSLLKPMMHRSDNFFAEQSLLMVSNEKLGYMSDAAIIDTLLKTDLKDLPQKPEWVDGSGLSRYNLFTPQDMVAVLLKMKTEFGLERIRNILPKGNTGTLTNYYQQLGPAIFAKTGSLSGQVALSGFLTAKTGKLLLFSILINNYNSSGRAVRRAMEKFVMQVWEKN